MCLPAPVPRKRRLGRWSWRLHTKTAEKRDIGRSTWSLCWSPANNPGTTYRRATWPVLTLWPAKRIRPLNCSRRVTRHVKGRP